MSFWNRVRFWRHRELLQRDLEAEMAEHRRMLERQFVSEGMAPAEAYTAAAIRFGNSTVSTEDSRDEWGFRSADALLRDIRFAARVMRKQPGVVLAAVLSIALGVGANTAVVSVLQALLINPLGVIDAGRIGVATVRLDKLNMRNAQTSAVEWSELSNMTDVFAKVAAAESRDWTSEVNGEAVRFVGQVVTPSLFEVFRITPFLGRFFNSDDREAVVLSWATWSSQFGSDPGVLGRTILLDGTPHKIIGVAPRHFRFPLQARVWTPLVFSPQRLARRGNNMNLTVLVQLKPGVSLAEASQRVNAYVGALKTEGFRDGNALGYFIDLQSFSAFVSGDLRQTLWILWAAALVVLFTACASVATLLLSRTAGRRREMAIRLSMGATRWHILRQVAVESIFLALIGGAAGIAVAVGAMSLLGDIAIPRRELLTVASMNAPLVFYGLGLSFLCAFIFGFAPALQMLRDDHAAAMSRSHRYRFQTAFVVAEVAAALVLLISTTLLMSSFWKAGKIDPGFNPDNVTTAMMLRPKRDPTFIGRLTSELRTMTNGSSALAYPLPFAGGGMTSSFSIVDRQKLPGEPEWHGEAYFVSPDYFAILQIPLLRGRMFSTADSESAPRTCIIDSRLAERYFAEQNPLGQKIAMYGGPAIIVGVAPSVRETSLETVSRPVVYYPLIQAPYIQSAGVLVRSSANMTRLIRTAVSRTNSSVAVFDARSLRERIDESLGMRRVMALLVLVFAGVCVLLATVGLHGVLGQIVSERSSEIAIRLALGGRPAQILLRFLASGLRWASAGIAVGLAVFTTLKSSFADFLFEVEPLNLGAFAFSCALILLVLAVAIWLPAWRASRIQPHVLLRYE